MRKYRPATEISMVMSQNAIRTMFVLSRIATPATTAGKANRTKISLSNIVSLRPR